MSRAAAAPPTATRVGRYFYWLAIVTALTVGVLQMYRVHGGWLTNYGADVFGTAWLYAMTRLGWTVFQRGRVMAAGWAAVIVFLLCALSEFGQRWGLVPGHFDPYDLLSYGLTLLACWLFDRWRPMVESP